MEGVTILNTDSGFCTEIAEIYGMQVFLCILALVMIIIGVVLYCTDYYSRSNVLTIMGIIMAISGFILFMFAIALHPTRYDVTIDDTVTYNKFTDRYDVIDVNDQIYTVELKE